MTPQQLRTLHDALNRIAAKSSDLWQVLEKAADDVTGLAESTGIPEHPLFEAAAALTKCAVVHSMIGDLASDATDILRQVLNLDQVEGEERRVAQAAQPNALGQPGAAPADAEWMREIRAIQEKAAADAAAALATVKAMADKAAAEAAAQAPASAPAVVAAQ